MSHCDSNQLPLFQDPLGDDPRLRKYLGLNKKAAKRLAKYHKEKVDVLPLDEEWIREDILSLSRLNLITYKGLIIDGGNDSDMYTLMDKHGSRLGLPGYKK